MVGNLKVVGNNETQSNNVDHLYAITTLDGLLMLAKREMILWYDFYFIPCLLSKDIISMYYINISFIIL